MAFLSKICPLFSSSSGNSTYIEGRSGAVLVDAGASLSALSAAISEIGGELGNLKAIFITHEHIDHVKGLKPLLKKTGISVCASKETLATLISLDKIPEGANIIEMEYGKPTEIEGIIASYFPTSHDCQGSGGYSFIMPDNAKISVCTDLGIVTDEVREAISGSKAILLESNHDIEMLKRGPYPHELKMRILSDKGHISNNTCATELKSLLEKGTERFILGHLSLNNNTPLLALSAAEASLMDMGAKNGRDYNLTVASPKGNRVSIV